LRDLDLIKTFPHARVSWSINTLDESFRREMDVAVSIERRLEAMRQFYEAGIETTCFTKVSHPCFYNVSK
jgi:DNA repair photolyase